MAPQAQRKERLANGLQPAFKAEIADIEGKQEAGSSAYITINDAINEYQDEDGKQGGHHDAQA